MTRQDEAKPEEFIDDLGDLGPGSAGQSGDTQGLSRVADDAEESVEELTEDGQAYEAEVIDGVEEAADHPERPVHTHEDLRRRSEP